MTRLEEIEERLKEGIKRATPVLWQEDHEYLIARVKKLELALEEMHKVLIGRQRESHTTLTSNPVQNGCLVYAEWALKKIKDKALEEE